MRALNLKIKACLLLAALVLGTHTPGAIQTLSAEIIHLGIEDQPEWDVFENKKSSTRSLQLRFESKANPAEATLIIRQDDVKQDWIVSLNSRKLGTLFPMEANLVHTLPIPGNVLRNGENLLEISSKTADDILLHELQVAPSSRRDLFADLQLAGVLNVTVTDQTSTDSLPCRITIVDSRGSLAMLEGFASTNLAARPGVVYTATGAARIGLLAGDYTVYATRGPEYSLASAAVKIAAGKEQHLALTLKREVDTHGWIASDTHLHTVTLSGHGDATVAERLITIAGEGIELPVVSEHNRHADYIQPPDSPGLTRYFTSVPGNEVTTRRGHFNIFPVDTNSPPPDHKIEEWANLMKRIRATPDVAMVILNHPTDSHSGFTPFAPANLNLLTGENLRGPDFSFDGVEVINSGAMRSDWMEPFRAWFSLLNYGYRLTGVGSSDSHDVSRFIAGQGRTYIKVEDSNPGAIDIQAACKNLKRGQAIISLGLFPEIRINETAGPGDLFKSSGPNLVVNAAVYSPSWIQTDRMELYANGSKIQEKIGTTTATWNLPAPSQDTWYVLVASGPGVTQPYWAMARPYQPSSRKWSPAAIGATNPVWFDADGDGQFTPPREVAKTILSFAEAATEIMGKLDRFDTATAIQAASLLEKSGADLKTPLITDALASAAPHVQKAFNEYIHAK